MILVPDTSVLIDGRITSMIKAGEYKGATIIVPEAVIAELEAQANNGREIGFSGLNELQQLCKMAEEKTIELKFSGIRPTLEQVKLASGGEIDAMIRGIAIENSARFITSDSVQAEVARAKGLDVIYLKPQISDFVPLGIDQFFDEHTIAVYLKERVSPMAKKGTISDMKLVKIRDAPTSEYELRSLRRRSWSGPSATPTASSRLRSGASRLSRSGPCGSRSHGGRSRTAWRSRLSARSWT